jgi:hypothetical protein
MIEVIAMDYSGFYEFPFPSVLSDDGIQTKNFFFALSDDEQLKLLNGSKSYENFQSRVIQRMKEA